MLFSTSSSFDFLPEPEQGSPSELIFTRAPSMSPDMSEEWSEFVSEGQCQRSVQAISHWRSYLYHTNRDHRTDRDLFCSKRIIFKVLQFKLVKKSYLLTKLNYCHLHSNTCILYRAFPSSVDTFPITNNLFVGLFRFVSSIKGTRLIGAGAAGFHHSRGLWAYVLVGCGGGGARSDWWSAKIHQLIGFDRINPAVELCTERP